MSKFKQLSGKAKAYVIGGVTLMLKARTLRDLDLLLELENDSKRSDALKKLIFTTLKEASDADDTDEDIWNFGIQHFKEITEAVLDVNGLKNLKLPEGN